MTLNSKTISKRVFISYSHDSPEHRDKVLELSERLRADGIDARIDQYVEHEGQNWPDWCEDQIRDADLVLMVCTSVYRAAVEGKALPGSRKGVCWGGGSDQTGDLRRQQPKGEVCPDLLRRPIGR